MGRVIPPVHSPLTFAALIQGAVCLASPKSGAGALAAVDGWIGSTWAPRAWALTNSGTSALALGMRMSAGAGERPRVALPAWACYDLATAADAADAEVWLYDVDPATLGPDWASLETALAAGARAVVVVHFAGLPVPMTTVRRIAAGHDALIIEDAAQAVGATFEGRPLGLEGDLAILSFGRGKGITAGGGGAILVHREALADRLEPLPAGGSGAASLAKSAGQWLLARPSLYAVPHALPFLRLGETIYHPPGPFLGLTRAGAGVLRRTLELAGAETELRQRHAARLCTEIAGSADLTLARVVAGANPGYLRLPVMVGGEAPGPRITSGRRLGVMPGYPQTLADLPGFGRRVRNPGVEYHGAGHLARRLATVPTHGQLREADFWRLAAWIAGPTDSRGKE